MRFFQRTTNLHVFAPEIHQFLVEADGKFLFPLKDTDKWTSLSGHALEYFEEIPKDTVPVEVRRKAGQRLGAYRRWHA